MGCLIVYWIILIVVLLAMWNVGTLVFTLPTLFVLIALRAATGLG